MANDRVREQLLNANKLIFVKAYGEAEAVLDRISHDPKGRLDILIHLRRIELAQMLGNLPELRQSMLQNFTRISATLSPEAREQADVVFELTMALADQHSGNVAPADAMIRFQDLLKIHKPHPAIHYGLAFALEGLGNNERAIWHYEQSIQIDPEWYPSYFALSQLHYQKSDEKRGDEYFFQFEQAAPYNVYGNFETHRKLYMEFFDEEQLDKAAESVMSLSAWWRENRGKTADEILIYESFALGRIAQAQGANEEFKNRLNEARQLARTMMDSPETEENTLYFVARSADEFNEPELAFEVYRHVLKRNDCNPKLVQKIGGQFLSAGEARMACDLFEDAYNSLPNSPEIRFCLLVGRLKLAGVNVEEYLISRERLKQAVENSGDKVETLALLHSLMAKFQNDPDILANVAEVYLKMGHVTKASQYFDRMYELDGKARATAIKYAGFKMQYGDPDEAMTILNEVAEDRSGSGSAANAEKPEIYWLKANYFARKTDFKASTAILQKAIALDPWNVSYLLQLSINLQEIVREKAPEEASDDATRDPALIALSSGGEATIDWNDFDRRTKLTEKSHSYDLAYVRRKLRFLYSNGSGDCLIELIRTSCRHSPEIATYEIIRLLNTNYDSPSLYWALGLLFKELWQLETAGMWLEQALLNPQLDDITRRRTLLELADCYIWRNVNLKKAVEFAKLAIELGERANGRAITVLAHAYLKQGNMRQAQTYLEQVDRDKDVEATFLLGLLQYRNGARQNANQIWKPLITVRSESLRFHNIKQEILRYYFEGSPYLKNDGMPNAS
jgi:Tfp pilus assembly protein PilF